MGRLGCLLSNNGPFGPEKGHYWPFLAVKRADLLPSLRGVLRKLRYSAPMIPGTYCRLVTRIPS